jgi:predicted peptidase
LALLALECAADDARRRGLDPERLKAADTDKDGKWSKAELGDELWERASRFDANGDGFIDAQEAPDLTRPRGRGAGPVRPGGANMSFEVREHKGSNGQTLRYSLFVPHRDQPGAATEALPLVLCLHGAGGNTAAANLLAGPKAQQAHPCIVMAPACDGEARWVAGTIRGKEAKGVETELMEALDTVIQMTKADPNRIYVTGQSMGGYGTWGLLSLHADKFAAAVPVCGGWKPDDASKMNGVAVWAFHGADDPTVPVSASRDMIAALKAASVQPEPKYTEFPGVGHGSWEPAYATPDLWDWMFAQRKKKG